MQANDTLQRFIFEQAPIRGEIVRLDATWRAVLARRDYPPAVRDLLGEMAAAAMLLSATLKFTGSLIMQIQGDGTVPLLVVECTSNRTLRAIAHWTEDVRAAPLAEMMGNGRLLITINPAEGTERYQGIVELEGNSVAEVLENYLARSEQLDTRLWLASNATQVAGMLLQRLPGEQDDEDGGEQDPHDLMRKRGAAKGKHEVGALSRFVGQPVGAADQENRGVCSAIAPQVAVS